MNIYVLTNQRAYIREVEYICTLFSSILKARFIPHDFSTPPGEHCLCIAYCDEDHFSSLPPFCRIKIIPNRLFWEHYCARTYPPMIPLQCDGLHVFGTPDLRPRCEIASCRKIATNLDLLSSAFFLVTRIEESCDKGTADTHGRYQFCNSIVGENIVDTPVIDLYAKKLAQWIHHVYGILIPFREPCLSAVITHDIDIPYYYQTWTAEMSELINSMRTEGKYKSIKDIQNYMLFLLGITPDPFDTFSYITKEEKKRNIQSTYFILMSKDNSWGLRYGRYSKQLKKLRSSGCEVALHPGYESFSHVTTIAHEKASVKSLSGSEPVGARNHFLRFDLPHTYQRCEALHLFYDSTLGYAEREGFRAGISTPFKPFDLTNRKTINLIEIPLIVMDGTLRDYRRYTPPHALEKIKKLVDVAHEVHGTITFNWHNTFLIDEGSGWREVFEKTLDYLVEKNAAFYTCSALAEKWRGYWEASSQPHSRRDQ